MHTSPFFGHVGSLRFRLYVELFIDWIGTDERTNDVEMSRYTYEVSGDLPIAEPSRGRVADEVLAVGWEVALDDGPHHIVVTRVDDGVAEHDHGRHQGGGLVDG